MSTTSSDDEDTYGPELPPHLLQKKVAAPESEKPPAVIGPSLPPDFKLSSSRSEELGDDNDSSQEQILPSTVTTTMSNQLEDDDEEEDDEDDIGPYPPDHPKYKRFSEQSYNKPISSFIAKPKREEWMLVPPKNKPISNLASRKFLPRALETRDDEHDEDNEEEDVKEEFQNHLIEKRDELMSNLLSSEGSTTRASESLLEIHRKTLKKRKIEEEAAGKSEKKERRPFDRDSDLKISGMSAEDKKRFINRTSTELQGRFAHGKRAGKFL